MDWSIFNEDNKNELTADLNELQEASIFIAADVIYDNTITLYFMNTLYKLMTNFSSDTSHKTKICYISNEQRVNFNSENLTATDTAFDFFRDCMNELDSYYDEELKVKFKTCLIEECSHDILPQHVCNYKRSKHLTIWKIESSLEK